MKATFSAVLSLPLAFDANSYDYIVVGGRVSGLVVAGRLTEDRRRTVLIIERGYFDNKPEAIVPWYGNLLDTSVLINPESAPNPKLNTSTFSVAVPAVVGGGSVVNGMGYIRGGKVDYDAWEELGNPGWGWQGLLPYFRKSTTFTPPFFEAIRQWNITFDPSVYGHDPLHTHTPNFQYPDIASVWDALRHQPGLAVPFTARGVRVVSRLDNTTRSFYARKEVVLAAGAIQTPQLLQVGGIRPRDVLRAAGIPVKRDTPAVGANLQDHATTMTSFDLANPSLPNPSSIFTNTMHNATVWAEDLANKTGPARAFWASPQLAYLGPTEAAPGPLLLWPSLGHPLGTCAIMPENLGGCVGPDLKVYDGLSVVDASIMPLTVSGALQAAVYAVAEKAADLVKAKSGH
ncbi:hypothetical protein B0T24DRAFT_697926 [Lasiosphaeria ovina]|uniref:Glucose-methanol-choline oxidoreductase N-terminal domain-containing protein n=1 Tax=Lasiosphaeria ovina TaxID=92902 RepID=A0AAE0N9D3_9PEZI|nr:hypothetical protein B0T24DRAFT_697926 [Lasiosphaeria ovina]